MNEEVVAEKKRNSPLGGWWRENHAAFHHCRKVQGWRFFAGKQLPVDTVAHGNKLQATADAA
jgi:hypothetical protein